MTRGHTRCARDSLSCRQSVGWSLRRTILLQLLRVMLHAIKSGWVYSVTYSVSCHVALPLHACFTPASRLLHALKLIACDATLAFPVSQTVIYLIILIYMTQEGHGDFTLVRLNFTDCLNLSSTPGVKLFLIVHGFS